MGFLLSFLLHPLLDMLGGGLVGFVRCRQGPKHPPAPLGTRCWGGTDPQPCSVLGWSCFPYFPSVALKKRGMKLGYFRQKTLQDESPPKSNKSIYYHTGKGLQENNLGLQSIPSSKPRYPSRCSRSALAEVTRNNATLV